jgi:hypothetical protein
MDNKAVMAQQIYEIDKAKDKIELAKRLLQNGVGIDVIARSTGLSKEQIEGLQKHTLEEPSVVNF